MKLVRQTPPVVQALLAAIDDIEREVAALKSIYDEHAGMQDRFVMTGQVLPALAERGWRVSMIALDYGQPVPDEVERGALAGEILQMLARGDEVSQVHQRNGKIVVLLGGGEGILVLIQLLIADIHVDLGAVA